MKLSWGHGIAAALIGFIAFIGTLVYGTFQQRVDLSSEDYYAQEVEYDNEKLALEQGLALGPIDISIEGTQLRLELPGGEWKVVEYAFRRANNADQDVTGTLEYSENLLISRPLPVGWWNVEIQTEREGVTYRWEISKYF